MHTCRHDVFSNRMAIKVQRPEGSKQPQHAADRWSKPFSIEVIDTDGVLRVGGYELGIGIQAAPEPAALTKVITFAPRYILRNRLRIGVAYRQHGTSEQVRDAAPPRLHWSMLNVCSAPRRACHQACHLGCIGAGALPCARRGGRLQLALAPRRASARARTERGARTGRHTRGARGGAQEPLQPRVPPGRGACAPCMHSAHVCLWANAPPLSSCHSSYPCNVCARCS